MERSLILLWRDFLRHIMLCLVYILVSTRESEALVESSSQLENYFSY